MNLTAPQIARMFAERMSAHVPLALTLEVEPPGYPDGWTLRTIECFENKLPLAIEELCGDAAERKVRTFLVPRPPLSYVRTFEETAYCRGVVVYVSIDEYEKIRLIYIGKR